uniref:Uncharacterized protein n=1 Tax=Meloidogyne floridensis TaxID=298350 RepID=A0A915NX37_9BILA
LCLGKIGCFIDASHRQRILISAFTRALKDPFPPARLSGVIALSATQQYFSLNEVAQKVLPNLSPLAVDPEKQVRDQTFKALSGFLEKLQKASDNPELIAEMEAQVKAGGKVGLLSGDKVPHWAGWAIKAISGKFYKSTTPTPETTTTEQQNVREVSSTKIENEKNISKGNVVNKMEDKKEATQNINKNISAISDGWGDEELSENEEEEEENQTIKNIGKINKNTRNISNNEEDDWGNSGGGTCAIDADSWESINDEEATLTSNIKSSLEIKSATSNKKPSPPITTKGTTTASSTGGKALKLGAVKMTHRQQQQQKDADLLLFGEEEDEYHQQQKIHQQPKKPSITKSSITSSSNNSNYGDEEEFNLNSNFGGGGGGGG